MSRQIIYTEQIRFGRRLTDMKQKGSHKGSSKGQMSTASPTHQTLSRSTRRGPGSHSPMTKVDDQDEDEEADKSPFNGRSSVGSKRSTAINGKRIVTPLTSVIKRRPERKRQERKVSVRKETYQLSDSESELTDAPDEEEEAEKNDEDAFTESDGEMAKRLQAAGDGESLLGSAASDCDHGETDDEEERFIIEDTKRELAMANRKRGTRRDFLGSALRGSDGFANEDEDDEEVQDYPDDNSGSLSPQTLQQLGLDGFEDELFEPQEAFHSSSEPSFTDFFGSGSEDETDDGFAVALEPRHDDDELTTDDDNSDVTDISDLDESMLNAPFLAREALAAGASTQISAGTDTGPADIPLLVIEDLDGRLIYARAGDGEAVFGSDGEFEFVDDSDEEDTDEEMDGVGFDYRDENHWTSWRANRDGQLDEGIQESEDGDTTDELPEEDMPFPRLLVGSVAPHGGRNARRARAMAAKSRRLSPNNQVVSRGTSRSRERNAQALTASENGQKEAAEGSQTQSAVTTPGEIVQELDFSISTEALARDPKGTLEAAAKSLGLTPEEVARLVAGIQKEPGVEAEGERSSKEANALLSPNTLPNALPMTPEQQRESTFTLSKPQMGSFMPSSFKSVHRAVIDGSRQAPSPFTNRHGMQKKGLANRKRQPSQSTPSSKRIRRFSSVDVTSQADAIGEETSEGLQTKASSSREGSPIDPMELDDVVDASMLWRGSYSSSPPAAAAAAAGGGGGGDGDQTTPVIRATKRGSNSSTSPAAATAGLNLNAFARWHRIPMGAFRDGQGAASTSSMSQQPLGSFLLTRSNTRANANMNHSQSRRKQKAAQQDQSPFRGRGEGDSIHLATAPNHQHNNNTGNSRSNSFIVSPVLWPVRHDSSDIHSNAAIWYTPKAMAPLKQNQAGKVEESTARKLVTRREKRQRRANRAAMKAAEGDHQPIPASWNGSPAPSNRVQNVDSPASALPRLHITDASPGASPLASTKALSSMPLTPLQSSASAATDIPNPSHANSSSSTTAATNNNNNNNNTLATNPNSHNILSTSYLSQSSGSSSSGSQQQPPSSVFGVPLHSPLFSGIFNPTNLGFRDDLEERDEEGVLTI